MNPTRVCFKPEIRSWIEHRLATVHVAEGVEGLCRITTHRNLFNRRAALQVVLPELKLNFRSEEGLESLWL
jgi:hypothetical protein